MLLFPFDNRSDPLDDKFIHSVHAVQVHTGTDSIASSMIANSDYGFVWYRTDSREGVVAKE